VNITKGILIAAAVAALLAPSVAAHPDDSGIDIASAGNGGVATAWANGGAASVGNINSGGNAGNAIGVGNTKHGDVRVGGGSVANATAMDLTVDGGVGIADTSGGSHNLAFGD
jgi:hypothetical protein